MIFLIIFGAFLLSLYNIHWYFLSDVRNHVEISSHYDANNNSITEAEMVFGTYEYKLTLVFVNSKLTLFIYFVELT